MIYVCPVEINDEVYQYYSKLLAMKGRIPVGQRGDVREEKEEEENDPENRYKIIVPDAVHKFPVSSRSLLSHVTEICSPSQSASRKHNQEKKAHIPLRTSKNVSAMFDNHTILFF